MSRNTALYLRTSTDRQDSGLEAQERALLDFCKSRKITNFEIYRERGISGKRTTRPELDRLMKDVHEGNVQEVIVYSFSRFARSTKHLLEALETFKEFNVDFISITENIDTSTPMGRAFFTVISAISQLERELIVERVKNGLKNAAAHGRFPGRPRSREPEPIITLRQKGLTYRQIAEVLGVGHSTIYRVIKEWTESE